jgi:beta-lactam-binding protein with PASTA domain
VAVPDVTGLDLTPAEHRLMARGLRWRYEGDDEVRSSHCLGVPPDGMIIAYKFLPDVVAQDPAPWTRVRRGDVVVLRLTGGHRTGEELGRRLSLRMGE